MTKREAYKLGVAYGAEAAEAALEEAEKGEIARDREAVEEASWDILQNQRQYAGHPTYDFAGERNADSLYEGFEAGETTGAMRMVDKAEEAGFFDEGALGMAESPIWLRPEGLRPTRRKKKPKKRRSKGQAELRPADVRGVLRVRGGHPVWEPLEGFGGVSRADHLHMMEDQDRWPAWPFLPLTRGGETGYLFAGRPNVRLGNIFAASEDDPEIPYADFEAVYADGWRID
jgi:hypothetical protein